MNTGNNLLFLIVSAMLGFMAVSGVAGWANIRALSLAIDLPEEIYRETDTLVVLRLANSKRIMPSFLLQISVCGTNANINYIGGSSTEKDSVVVRFPNRGRHAIREAIVSSPFPVNFFVRSNRLRLDRQCIVFPAPLRTSLPAVAEDRSASSELFLSKKGIEGELSRIRDYAGGDPLRMIHWRLSAKHPLLKVKELSSTGGEPVVIDLRSLPGQNTETRLSSAAFLVNRLIRDNRAVGLRAGDKIIQPDASTAHRLRLLTELALYDQN